MKNVLLVRLSSLGDVIFNIPLANVLKKNGYSVTWIVSEKGYDIVNKNPAVDKTILLPIQKWKKKGFCLENIIEFFKFLNELRSVEYNIAIDTQMMFKSMAIMRLCKAKRKICYKYGREFSYLGGNEKIIPKDVKNYTVHAVEMHMTFAEYLGLEGTDEIKFTLPESSSETKIKIDNLLKNIDKSKPIAVIAPATTWKLKHWNKDNWKQLVSDIKDKCSLVFTGTNADRELISYIGGDNFLNLAGQTGLLDLVELFQRAKLVIAPDSGSAHLARATNKCAVISIFCCTPPKVYGPFGDDNKYFALDGSLPCQPCHKRHCNRTDEGFEQCVNYPKPEVIESIVNKILD